MNIPVPDSAIPIYINELLCGILFVISLIFTLFFLITIAMSYYDTIVQTTQVLLERVSLVMVLLLCLFTTAVSFRLLLQEEPELIITQTGLQIHRIGFIAWNDIELVDYSKTFSSGKSSRVLKVKVRNTLSLEPSRYKTIFNVSAPKNEHEIWIKSYVLEKNGFELLTLFAKHVPVTYDKKQLSLN
jgi:hypothetical protein